MPGRNEVNLAERVLEERFEVQRMCQSYRLAIRTSVAAIPGSVMAVCVGRENDANGLSRPVWMIDVHPEDMRDARKLRSPYGVFLWSTEPDGQTTFCGIPVLD